MKLLDQYNTTRNELFKYFNYVEDWVVIPLDDRREMIWGLTKTEQTGSVRFAETLNELKNEEAGEYYEDEIYTQRFLPKWVYRGKDYTMICVDTHTDGNKFLAIYTNEKEVDLEEL